jgi:hypothetical protein
MAKLKHFVQSVTGFEQASLFFKSAISDELFTLTVTDKAE